jgi:RimJ/RimL family protein N-acetyltransferase
MKKLLASADDIFHLAEIYFDVYEGTYSDPLMRDPQAIKNYILSQEGFWFIAKTEEGQVVASVLINYDQENLIAKAYGAVVRHEFRGKNLMEDLLQFGIDYLKEHTNGVDIIYSTTRTVNEAAQTLTENLGFKKLGIFPNTHRTRDFETHCLTAIITPEALAKRHSDYKIHHDLENLFNIVAGEIPLPPLESIVPVSPTKELIDAGELEVIRSKKFVNYRYNQLKNDRSLEKRNYSGHFPTIGESIEQSERVGNRCGRTRLRLHLSFFPIRILSYQNTRHR